MQLSQFLIGPETPIIDAMSSLDKLDEKILYVVSKDNVLLGAVTDRDIRRYILKKQSIQGTIDQVMYKDVRYLEKESNISPNDYMNSQMLTSIPIVDGQKRIVAIEFLQGNKYYQLNEINIPVVIMAGGKGTRLTPYTQILPKPLIPIGEKTITEHIMDHFEQFGCKEFTMIVNYKKELIKAFFGDEEFHNKISFVEEEVFQGTAGGLRLIKGKINTTFFMSNCDILINENYVDIYRYHIKNKNVLTMVCALKREAIPYGVVTTKADGTVAKLEEKPQMEFLTNTGLYVIEPEFLDYIGDAEFIHITDVIQKCINNGVHIGVYPISENDWLDMGQMEQLNIMKAKLGVD